MRAVLIGAIACLTALTFYITSTVVPNDIGSLLTAQSDDVRTDLSLQIAELESNSAAAMAQMQQARNALEFERDGLMAVNNSLVSGRDALRQDLVDANQHLEALRSELATQNDLIIAAGHIRTALEDQLDQQHTQLAQSQSTIDALTEELEQTNGNTQTASAEILAHEQSAIVAADRIAQLERDLSTSQQRAAYADEQQLLFVSQIRYRDSQLADLRHNVTTLTADLASANQPSGTLVGQTATLVAQVASLEVEIADRETQVAYLQAELSTANTENAAQTQALEQALEEQDTALRTQAAALTEAAEHAASEHQGTTDATNVRIDQLLATLNDRDAALAERNAMLAERDATIIALETALPADAPIGQAQADLLASQNARLTDMTTQITQMSDQLAEQDITITNLRLGLGELPDNSLELAQVCEEKAAQILTSTQISFRIGTSRISEISLPILQRLSDLAIGCQNDALQIEIGGHTDSQGGEEANIALSEARAQAVLTLMADYGVPADSMVSVGYGEAQPIATNDTPEGRALNRRITFVWQSQERAAHDIDRTEFRSSDLLENAVPASLVPSAVEN